MSAGSPPHHFAAAGWITPRAPPTREDDLHSFFEGYSAVARRNGIVARHTAGRTDIFPDSWSSGVPVEVVRQLCLYANRIYLHDPLLDAGRDLRALHIDAGWVLNYPDRTERLEKYRGRLAAALKDLAELSPLIEAGVVHIVPTQLLGDRRQPGEVRADDLFGPTGSGAEMTGGDTGGERLGAGVRAVSDALVRVMPARIVDGIVQLFPDEPLKSQNMIAVGFDGDPFPTVFPLGRIVVPDGPAARRGEFSWHFDTSCRREVDPDTFGHWVRGSRDKVVEERVSVLKRDLMLAAIARARFLTSLPASAALAEATVDASVDIGCSRATTAFLQVDLPYFDRVAIRDLAAARRNEAAFEDFRAALEDTLREAAAAEHGDKLQERLETMCRDLLIAPIAKIERRASALKRTIFIDAALLVGTLASAVITHGNTVASNALLVASAVMLNHYKGQKAQQDAMKEMPGYFFWELTKRARR